MPSKVCTKCSQLLDVEQFATNRVRFDGRQSQCRACKAKYAHAHHKRNAPSRRKKIAENRKVRVLAAREHVKNYLSTNPCMNCGESNPIVLEFDHVRGTKKNNISDLVCDGFSVDVIQVEIDKCDVVCANCHRIRTSSRGYWWKQSIK